MTIVYEDENVTVREPDLTPELEAAMAEARTRRQEKNQILEDAQVKALVNASPAQTLTFCKNNLPSLTPAEQRVIARIVLAVSALGREEFVNRTG